MPNAATIPGAADAIPGGFDVPTNDEINNRLTSLVESGFQHFTVELNAFHGNQWPDANMISVFLTRVHQYSMLFWGYENVIRSLGTADANQINRIAQIRSMVDGQVPQLQNLLNHSMNFQHNYQPPLTGQNAIQQAQSYQTQVMAEVNAKRQQMFAYTNRLRELTQGGVPYIQAEILAKQETGYR
jgi:hypothetical protein